MLLIVLSTTVWALALRNSIFIDESLYIFGGRTLLDHWFTGTAADQELLVGFSGSPEIFPVLAAALDHLGGLWLVRLFSLVCVITTMFLVRAITARIFDERSGLLAAAFYGFSAPVIYVAHLGTFDALVIALLALALWIGVTRRSYASAVMAGAILALAVATKYTAIVFVLPVALTPFLTSTRKWDRRLLRPVLTLGVCAALVYLGFITRDATVRDSIAFTTSAREALSPAPVAELAGRIPRYLGMSLPFAVLALAIAALRVRSWRWSLLALGLLTAAAALPLAQMRMGEGISFEKHLAYSTFFLAPIAGWALQRVWRYSYSILVVPLVVFLTCLLMVGAFRAQDLYTWPDVAPVVEALDDDLERGVYMSPMANSLKYYLSGPDYPGVRWEATFNTLYPRGRSYIESSVADGKFAAVVLQAGASDDPDEASLRRALEQSPHYVPSTVPAQHVSDPGFVIYTRQ